MHGEMVKKKEASNFRHFYPPSITCFRRQFQRNTWPIQLAFLLFIVYIRYSPPPCHYVILLHFSYDQYNWSFPFVSKTLFRKTRHFTQEIRTIYDILVCYHTLYISWCSWIRAFLKKNPTRWNNVSTFYYSIFIWSSTCFGRHTVHH
jgi:hypothetical protein